MPTSAGSEKTTLQQPCIVQAGISSSILFPQMNPKRLLFALEQLKPEEWSRFEKFASEFLQSDYPDLRTMASSSGDKGRDSELFSPAGEASVMFQYSVSQDWASKVRKTAIRIGENFDGVMILVYVTNQEIGAKADDLKKELRKKFRLSLDIYDRSWFLERLTTSERQATAERLAADIADPLLKSGGFLPTKTQALTSAEAITAVFHLQMQWEDESREKGLTKLSYEALVKSVLRENTPKSRSGRKDIFDAICRIISKHPRETVEAYVTGALQRLSRKDEIKHWPSSDDYCLSHSEDLKVKERLAEKALSEQALRSEIYQTIIEGTDEQLSTGNLELLIDRTRRVLDQLLVTKGEEFASAVAEGRSRWIPEDFLGIAINKDFSGFPDDTNLGDIAVEAVRSATRETLLRSSPSTQTYLRRIADGYTLFSFMRAVPDVQKAVQKIFSSAEIWLDSSVILPALAETLAPEENRIVSRLLLACKESGILLRVTEGILEEIERHINRCRTYQSTRRGEWVGGVPFLYAMFALQPNPSQDFAKWSNNFAGDVRPIDDVAEYLEDQWGITVENLHDYVESADNHLRWRILELWRDAHKQRRKNSASEHEDHIIEKLVNHDVECYLGIIQKRSSSTTGNLGYREWWLTFDKTVIDFEKGLRKTLGPDTPNPPVLSPDFLADYLAVGPNRSRLSKDTETSIPISFFDAMSDHIPEELLGIAEELRQEFGNQNDRLIRRRLRDAVDLLRRKTGDLAKGGLVTIRKNLEIAIRAKTKDR